MRRLCCFHRYASVSCWPLKQRAADGTIVADPTKFPNGMASFSKKLRALGLDLGIYTSHSNFTCQKYPGALGHEAQDAASFASWGVAFVKNDWCSNRPGFPATDDLVAFDALRDALAAASKAAAVPSMTYSIHWNFWNTAAPGCARATSCPLPATANMWRIGNDIGAKWSSVLGLIDVDTPLAHNAGPGRWNDADMMQVWCRRG